MLLLKLTKSLRKTSLTDSIKCYSTAIPSPNADKIELFVDDKKVFADPGMTILQACALAGVEIPRYCYHERLSIAGNCRMCLVEVEKSVKPVASCAMPAMKGMKIKTNSPMTRKAREGVMEFLLVNHPLDCPICDQGGECDLQDQSMAFGSDRSRFVDIAYSGKRAVENKNIGPLVKTIMNRCIHCTRCIRFASEVAGVDDLGTTGRGSDMQVGTYIQKMLYSELSGNVIDLCPVGALTSKPYAFVARPWETRKTESIDVMDAVGSNIVVSTRGGEVLRILPKINDDINEEWISDKTRFAYDGLKYQRLVTPMFRPEGRDSPFVNCEWEDVLLPLGRHFCHTPPDKMMAVVGNTVDTESVVALKEFYKRLGSSNVYIEDTYPTTFRDHRASYLLNSGIAGIEESDLIIVIGCNPRLEAPIINARIRKTWLHNETDVAYLGAEVNLSYEYYHLGQTSKQLIELVQGKHAFTQRLNKARRPLVILGYTAIKHSNYGEDLLKAVLSFSQKLQEKAEQGWKVFNVLHTSANMVGALDAGLKSDDCAKAFNKITPSLVYLLGSDNNLQLIESIRDRRRVNSPPLVVVYQGHHGDLGASVADYILPGSAYTEKYGTYVNTEGRAQYSQGAATAPGRARVDWQILRAMSEFAESYRVQQLATTVDPLVTRGQVSRSLKLLSSNPSTSRTLILPFEDLTQARHLMALHNPVLVEYGRLSDNHTDYAALMASIKGMMDSGQVSHNKLMQAAYTMYPAMRTLKDFYMTDPISRASVTMAKCVQAAVEAERTKHFTQGEIKVLRA